MVELSGIVGIKGRSVFATDGERIGKVDEIYVAGNTKRPEWISLGTGLFGTGTKLVPVEGATFTKDGMLVRFTKDRVKGSPDVDTHQGYLEKREAMQLCEYYGVPQARTPVAGGPPDQQDVRRPGSMTSPAEEERLRRWIE